MKILFFYEFIDWVMVSQAIGKYLGHGAGVIIASLLKIISILIISPLLVIILCLCAYLILSNLKGVRHEGYLHKYIQNCKN